MNTDPLGIRITEVQRDRVLNYLQDAYADGRLDEESFDLRLGQALDARTRGELNKAFSGLAVPSLAAQAVQRPAAVLARRVPDAVVGLMHLSPLVSFVAGPAISYAIADPNSLMRAEAAKSLNFHIWITIGAVLSVTLGLTLAPDPVFMLFGLLPLAFTWLVSTTANGIRALGGRPVRYPMRQLPIIPVREP